MLKAMFLAASFLPQEWSTSETSKIFSMKINCYCEVVTERLMLHSQRVTRAYLIDQNRRLPTRFLVPQYFA